jgi:hypothetical protein
MISFSSRSSTLAILSHPKLTLVSAALVSLLLRSAGLTSNRAYIEYQGFYGIPRILETLKLSPSKSKLHGYIGKPLRLVLI